MTIISNFLSKSISVTMLTSDHLVAQEAMFKFTSFVVGGEMASSGAIKCRVKLCVNDECAAALSQSCPVPDEGYGYTLTGIQE